MATPPVTLDQGPPLPPNLQPQPQPSVQQLAGQSANPSGSASLQQAVVQKLMFVEQSLDDIATMMPAAGPAIGDLINQLRKGMGAVLAQGAEPPPAPMGGNSPQQTMMPPMGAPTS